MKQAIFSALTLLAAVTCSAEEKVAGSEVEGFLLDTRKDAVRKVSGAAGEQLAFAYNNSLEWANGGDETGEGVSIRITEMNILGEPTFPGGWTAAAAAETLVGTGSEGVAAWDCGKRSYYRVELIVGEECRAVANLDLAELTGEWTSSAIQILDFSQVSYRLFAEDGGYRATGILYDRNGTMLTEGTDYQLAVVTPEAGLPATVTVSGGGKWTGSVEVPLGVTEVVMSVSAAAELQFDTRLNDGEIRALDGAAELLPLARTNAGDWRMDGVEGEPTAALTVTPVVALPNAGQLVWLAVGTGETLVSAAGEGVYGDWEPTGVGYRVTLAAEGETIESVIVDLTGYLAQRHGQVTIAGGNCPAVGQPLTVTLKDADGNEFTPAAISWARRPADRSTTATLATGVNGYTPVAADLEQWITLSIGGVGEAEASYVQDIWISKLPVVYVQVEGGAWPTAAKEEHTGTLRLQGNDRWQSDKVLYDGALDKIHVRGNSTKDYPKKPYKLKLDQKADLLGMGKSKHWVLLANYQDPGLMRNKITQDFSAELGLTAMASEWVEVVFNGEYVGNYLLCEHIRIDEGRVDIHNWEDTAEDIAKTMAKVEIPEKGAARSALEAALADSLTADLGWLTTGEHTLGGKTYRLADYLESADFDLSGGYLFELDTWDDEPSKFRVTSGNIQNTLIKVNSPEMLYTNQPLMEALQAKWTQFFAAVQSADGYADGKSWAEIAEVKSMAAYWLTQVLSANPDVPRSRFAYQDQGGKLQFGPAWDFDVAYGGWAAEWTLTADGAGEIVSATPKYATCGWLNGNSCVGQYATASENFYPLWVDDPYFCLVLYELWQEKRDYLRGLVADGGTLDEHYDYLLESGLANDALWPVKSAGAAYDRFDGELGSAKRMKACLKAQIEWIDTQMTSLGTLVASLRSAASDHPYTDARENLDCEVATEHSARLDGRESETLDMVLAENSELRLTVTLAGLTAPATVAVYVNGMASGSFAVQGSTAAVNVGAGCFTRRNGARNLVALVVRNAAGETLATTYALVTTMRAGLEPQLLKRAKVAVGRDAANIAGLPVVTVYGPDGGTLVAGRDYTAQVEVVSVTEVRVTVTGAGGYDLSALLDGQVNLLGQVELVYESGERVVPLAADGRRVGLDTRRAAVRKLGQSRELLPFAWNNAAEWPQGGEGETRATVTLQPMTGKDPTDPTGWTAVGAGETIVDAAGEGVMRPRGLKTLLYRAQLTDGAAIDETAYFDLTEMAYKQGLMLILK